MAGDGQVIKLQNLCFKFALKKYHARTGRLKKSCRAGAIKKISSNLKILQPLHQKSNGPPLNDVVLVAYINTVRGKWSIGGVAEVFPRSDGPVRNVKVKTSAGE